MKNEESYMLPSTRSTIVRKVRLPVMGFLVGTRSGRTYRMYSFVPKFSTESALEVRPPATGQNIGWTDSIQNEDSYILPSARNTIVQRIWPNSEGIQKKSTSTAPTHPSLRANIVNRASTLSLATSPYTARTNVQASWRRRLQ
eukprot:SAG31_NODE_18117_length_646_cov_1.082267_1_plen_142_part_10